jgi:hypothetical protein
MMSEFDLVSIDDVMRGCAILDAISEAMEDKK